MEKTFILGRIQGRRMKGQQQMRGVDSIMDSMNMNVSKLQEIVKDKGSLVHCGVRSSQELDMT